MREYLIYTSAGEDANVKVWASSKTRNYDIWVTNYTDQPGLNSEYADFYNEHAGTKIPNLYEVFLTHKDHLQQYKAIMVADDDVLISPRWLSHLFKLSTERDLWMLQPAFSRFGRISHPLTARKLNSELRFVNFVEITCPIFRTEKLLEFLSIYTTDMPTIVGIDYWLPYFFGIENEDKYAISDRFYCINPRDQFKRHHTHVIDKISSPDTRTTMIATTLKSLGIRQFQYQEYANLPRPFIKRLTALPVFLVELCFAWVWSNGAKIARLLHLVNNQDVGDTRVSL